MRSARQHRPGPGANCSISGFSLPELLVALGTVAALIMLLGPVAISALDSFRASASVSRMRTLGHGLLAAAAERGGRLPDLASPDDPSKAWDAAIMPYLGLTGAGDFFRCPLDNVRPLPGSARRSYGVTAVALGFPPWDGGDAGRPPGQGIALARIAEPARFVMLTRVQRSWERAENHVGNVAFCAYNGIDPRDPTSGDWRLFRGRTPYGFADGHVALVTPAEAVGLDPAAWRFGD